jgi:hypothetical protein
VVPEVLDPDTTPKPDNEDVVFEDFFIDGLRMPAHPALTEILLRFQAQLHQLRPNAIMQLSMFFWAVGSFGCFTTADTFVKRYELHYKPKKV